MGSPGAWARARGGWLVEDGRMDSISRAHPPLEGLVSEGGSHGVPLHARGRERGWLVGWLVAVASCAPACAGAWQ